MLKVDEFAVDTDALQAYICGQPINLSLTELRLLLVLLGGAGRVQSRDEIRRKIWSHMSSKETRVIDRTMSRLRDRVGEYASRFETLRGKGYRYS